MVVPRIRSLRDPSGHKSRLIWPPKKGAASSWGRVNLGFDFIVLSPLRGVLGFSNPITIGIRAVTAHKADALELWPAIRIHTPKPTMRAEIALASASSIGRPTGKTGSTSPLGQGQNVPAREASPKRRWIFTQNSPRNGGGLLRVVGVEGALFIRPSAHSLGKAF